MAPPPLANLPKYLPSIPSIAAFVAASLHVSTVFYGGIVWDDRAALSLNPDAIGLRPISQAFSHDFWGQDITAVDSHKSYRPLSVLSLRLNHAVHGLSPWGYHLGNVVVHAAVTFVFSHLCALILAKHSSSSSSSSSSYSSSSSSSSFTNFKNVAAVASILFAVHPIHAEPVSCIVGRSDLLCGLFFVLGVSCHFLALNPSLSPFSLLSSPSSKSSKFVFSGVDLRYFLPALLAGFVATLCKELGVTVFGVYVAHEMILALCHTQPASPTLRSMAGNVATHFSRRTVLPRVAVCLLCPVLITMGHFAVHRGAPLYKWTILENEINLLPNFSDRAMSYAHTHFLYLLKLFLPVSLCYDYGYPCIPPVLSPLDYRNVLSALSYFGVLYFGYSAAVSKNAPKLWAGALLAVPFIPASNVLFPVGTVLGERLLYIPSMGFCLAAAAVICEVADDLSGGSGVGARKKRPKKQQQQQQQSPMKQQQRNKGNGSAAAAEAVTTTTTTTTAAVPPAAELKRSARLFSLFLLLLFTPLALKSAHRAHEWRSETSLFESSMSVCPRSLKVLNNLALVLLKNDTAVRAGTLLDTAIEILPDYPSAVFNRGLVHYILKEWASAVVYFERALELDSNQPKARAYLAQTQLTIAFDLQKEGRWEDAKVRLGEVLIQADAALQLGCTLPLAFHVRCQVGHELEMGEESLWYCDKAIEINTEKEARGDDPNELIVVENSHNAAALIYRALGEHRAAVRHYEAGLVINPECFEILVNMGGLLTDMGRQVEAMEYYNKALKKEPESPELITNIGWLLELQGFLEDARDHYARALELLHPYSHPQIVNNLNNVKSRIAKKQIDEEQRKRGGGERSGRDGGGGEGLIEIYEDGAAGESREEL